MDENWRDVRTEGARPLTSNRRRLLHRVVSDQTFLGHRVYGRQYLYRRLRYFLEISADLLLSFPSIDSFQFLIKGSFELD